MPYFIFLWDGENDDHVAQHGVTMAEFEEIVMDPDFVDRGRAPGRWEAEGTTSTGKRLLCVYDELDDGIGVYPVTAFEIG